MKKTALIFFFFHFILFSCFKDNALTSQAQLKLDTISIAAFLKKNNIVTTKVQPGIWYTIDSLTLGVYPVLTDSVVLSYTAKLIPSMAQVGSATSLTVLLSSAITGMQLGLPKFPVGSSGELYIPSGLAFGAAPNTGTTPNSNYAIPPNANLLYKVKLLGIKGTQLANDIAAIDTYTTSIADSLRTGSITLFKDPSGVRYAFDSVKTSAVYPVLKDSVLITYSLKILNATKFITIDTTTKVLLNTQLTGWKIGLPKIPQGVMATLYVPSGYAYGNVTSITVPGNSNLVYQLKLLKVIHHP